MFLKQWSRAPGSGGGETELFSLSNLYPKFAKTNTVLKSGLPEPERPGAALFGWSRSRIFGPAPAPTPTHRTVNILFLRDPKYDYDCDYDYDDYDYVQLNRKYVEGI